MASLSTSSSRASRVAASLPKARTTFKDVWVPCGRKHVYDSREAAQVVADKLNAQARLGMIRKPPPKRSPVYTLVAYVCPEVRGHFHIGHDRRIPLTREGPLPPKPRKPRGGHKPPHPEQVCVWKNQFDTWTAAEAQALVVMSRVQPTKAIGSVYVYRCRRCGHWHYKRGRRGR